MAPINRIRDDRGQALVLVACFMFTLLAMSAVAIDVGSWYQSKRSAQSQADAAALAGASQLPSGNWNGTALQYAAKNAAAGDSAVAARTAYLTTGDSVTVTVTREAPAYFANVFGIESVSVEAVARATVQPAGTMVPFAVQTGTFDYNSIFVNTGTSNYGTIDLPAISGGCRTPTTKPDVIAFLSGTCIAAPVEIGDSLSTKPGATQPTAKAVDDLPGSLGQDLVKLSNGLYQILPQSYHRNELPPRLVIIPVVTPWGNGNSTVTVEDFAWFYITGYTGKGSSISIQGLFVELTRDGVTPFEPTQRIVTLTQ